MGSVPFLLPVVGGVSHPIDAHCTSKKVTYHLTCLATFDVSSSYFDDNEILQYLQGNDTCCL